MKNEHLKIECVNKETDSFAGGLGISEERVNELLNKLNEKAAGIADSIVVLGIIADMCDNLNEFAFFAMQYSATLTTEKVRNETMKELLPLLFQARAALSGVKMSEDGKTVETTITGYVPKEFQKPE